MKAMTLDKAQAHAEWTLNELERECARFLELRARLRGSQLAEDERGRLKADLYALVTMLQSYAEVAQDAMDAETEAMPDDD